MIYIKLRDHRNNEFIYVQFISIIQLSYFTLGFSHSKRNYVRKEEHGNKTWVEFLRVNAEMVIIECLEKPLKELYLQGWDLAIDGCTIDIIRLQPYTVGWPEKDEALDPT